MPGRVTTICSGFSPHGYEQYGRRFMQTMDRFLPALGLNLAIYVEQRVACPIPFMIRSLWDCAGAEDFVRRNGSDPTRNGAIAIDVVTRQPRSGEPEGWRWDALKFFKQCMIPENASRYLADGDILCWLDADVVAFAPIPAGIWADMLGDADLCYMGRGESHSEIGFWAVRLHPATRRFLFDLAELYRSDAIFELPEYHSAFAFDHCRRWHETGMKVRNLTPTGRGGENVWWRTPLRDCLDHLKGPHRKRLGKSPERDLTPAQFDEMCAQAHAKMRAMGKMAA